MQRTTKHVWQAIAKRGTFIVAILLLCVSILFTWFLVTGFSQSQTTVAIGVAALSAFFAAISSIAALLQATELQRQRENQERPYITAYFAGTSRGAVYFEIQNAGNSPAIDVALKFEHHGWFICIAIDSS
jgi:NADH:ubiquinone oxidoreductase subunit 2 (subunit N)